MSKDRIAPVFLAEFDLRVIGREEGDPCFVVGINPDMVWISPIPVRFDGRRNALKIAKRVGPRILSLLHEELMAGAARFVPFIVDPAPENCRRDDGPAQEGDELAMTELLSFLMETREWPDAADLLNLQQRLAGLGRFDSDLTEEERAALQPIPKMTQEAFKAEFFRQVRSLAESGKVHPAPGLFLDSQGRAAMYAFAVDSGDQVARAIGHLVHKDPGFQAIAYGFDRWGKAEQGTKRASVFTWVVEWHGEITVGIVEYDDQAVDEPCYDNAYWNYQMRSFHANLKLGDAS